MSFFERWSRRKGAFPKAPFKAPGLAVEKNEPAVKKEETKTEKTAGGAISEPKSKKYHPANRLLIKPLVTEKSTYLQSNGQYGFEVQPQANKQEIKKAVEAIYGVRVTCVRLMNYQGKKKRYGRISGQRKDRRKAIVTLKKGERIELYKNV